MPHRFLPQWMVFSTFKSEDIYQTRYVDVSSEDSSEKDESENFLSETSSTQTKTFPSRSLIVLPWILALFFASVSLFLWLKPVAVKIDQLGTFAHGYATDFEPVRGAIELLQVTFTGSPSFLENGTMYVPHPSKINYVGEPSDEIDQAWEDLTHGRYFRITEEEAISAFGDARDVYWSDKIGGYMAGLDMFHALHCLNRIRRRFSPDYYPESDHRNHRIHADHCIDHIRQVLMCSGDMTPIPTPYYEALERNYVDSDVPHTCRNFGKLREWLSTRFQGIDEVPESSVKKHGGHF